MNILKGNQADTFEEAAVLAFCDAGKGELSPQIATIFVSAIDAAKFNAEAERSINAAVHSRYGRSATWYGKKWLIPLPQPRYDARPIPQLTFMVQGYTVAAGTMETRDTAYRVTLVGPVDKSARLILPISFLQAILDDDLEQFELMGRDGAHTSWNVPGLRQALRLPNDFIARLGAALRLKSVVSWLLDFGPEGKAVAPLVAGSLLGLQFHGITRPLPIREQQFQREVVIAELTRMYGSARAAEMFEKCAPYLKSSMSNHEAVSLILKETTTRRY